MTIYKVLADSIKATTDHLLKLHLPAVILVLSDSILVSTCRHSCAFRQRSCTYLLSFLCFSTAFLHLPVVILALSDSVLVPTCCRSCAFRQRSCAFSHPSCAFRQHSCTYLSSFLCLPTEIKQPSTMRLVEHHVQGTFEVP